MYILHQPQQAFDHCSGKEQIILAESSPNHHSHHVTYLFSSPLKKGNVSWSVFKLAKLCTRATGAIKKTRKAAVARRVAVLRNQNCLYGIARFGQYISRGSGA